MRLVLLHILFFLFNTSVFSQSYLSRAKEIRNLEHAQAFTDSVPQVILGFMHDKMGNPDYDAIKKELEPGTSFESGGYHVVVVKAGKKNLYRFRLITMSRLNNPEAEAQIETVLKELKRGSSFETLFETYAENIGPESPAYGDVGWVDIDFFVDSFKSKIVGKKKGDQFIASDPTSGWYNVVDMTHNPQAEKGHFVLLIPNTNTSSYFNTINHHKNIGKLTSSQQMRDYAGKHPVDVQLELLNEASNPQIYAELQEQLKSKGSKSKNWIVNNERAYQFISDTSVQLLSLQYIYLNGSELSREQRSAAIHDIYDQFYANVPFDSIVQQYWPDNNGLSTLQNIESGLLADDLVEKVKTTTVGQLFVARVGQSYFLGVPIEKPKQRESYLVISYPKPSSDE